MATPDWTWFAKPNPDAEYVAVLSYLPLRSFWALPQFFYYTRAIRRQLEKSRGLLGYSLLAHVMVKRFWTLSVWQDEVALQEFIHKQPHSEAMMFLHRSMAGSQFVCWKIAGDQAPPSWADAMARSRAEAEMD